MSHVTSIELEINDLTSLAKAAEDVGCELVEGQTTYKWYGTHVGDYPLPAGFTKADLGKCEHAIRVKGSDGRTYEVGVVKNPSGKGYTLLWDFWNGGYGLQDRVGKDAVELRKNYAARVAERKLRAKGYKVKRRVDATSGQLKLIAT